MYYWRHFQRRKERTMLYTKWPRKSKKSTTKNRCIWKRM